MKIEQVIPLKQTEDVGALFGNLDENVKLVEREYDVSVLNRDASLKVGGESENVLDAVRTLKAMIDLLSAGEPLTEQRIRYIISSVREGQDGSLSSLGDVSVCLTAKGRPVRAKTFGQKKYVEAILGNTITLGVGPAGTGKTYLAVAMAVKAFRNHDINRIILTRPAVEAGEKLGFLPGDLQDKVDPYLRPLYDALFEMLGGENYQKYVERGSIEVAPLAYMRGRTLDDSFIILDEAQNTTPEQMKMFLTRLGNQSKMVITGDITQIDLDNKRQSGLVEVLDIVKNVEGIASIYLTDQDVVRHVLVQRIIAAYERYYNHEEKQ